MYDVQDGLHEGHVSDGDACKPIAGGLHGWLHNMTAKSKSGHWLKGHGPSRSLTPQELGSSGAWLLVWGSPFSIISLLLFSAEVAMAGIWNRGSSTAAAAPAGQSQSSSEVWQGASGGGGGGDEPPKEDWKSS